jgi:two-component system, sensor histidine kinase
MSAGPVSVVLVVDDQDAGRFAKSAILRRAGFAVHEAATGAEALQQAAAHSPDVVVLDVNLPDMNGLDVGRRLREAQRSLPALQILHVSGTAISSSDRARGLDQGGDAYLTEPIDPAVLVATVRALLRVRRAEAELAMALERERAARKQLEEASRLKDEFIATLSHELRTPLNALMGWLWQLRHSTLDVETQQRALDSLERNARLQAQLINDLLDISRITRGKLRLEMRFVDLATVIAAAAESIRESVERRHLDLRVDAGRAIVGGDQSRLQQVIANLLSNAVQFTPDGGAITVTLGVEGDAASVRVRDTGAGIDPAFLPRVFDQFRQGEGRLSRKHGGLGLGLSVVKQLVELHDGAVSVESRGVGLGATFTVTLPCEAGDRHDLGALLLHDMNILAVADHEDALAELSSILEASGARVVTGDGSTNGGMASPTPIHAIAHIGPISAAYQSTTPAIDASAVSPAQLVRRLARLVPDHSRA